ncbi:hypothetical protein Hanom_Chr04g00340511 [Helianthus anomalus]
MRMMLLLGRVQGFLVELKMDSQMLYFRCCSKLDCIDLILRSNRVGCGFMSRICCLFFFNF